MLKTISENYRKLLHDSLFNAVIPTRLPLGASQEKQIVEQTAKDFTQFKVDQNYISFGEFTEKKHDISHSFFNVLNTDKPFLFDSITNAVKEAGFEIIMTAHPVFCFERLANHSLGSFRQYSKQKHAEKNEVAISFVHVQLSEKLDGEQKKSLRQKLETVLLHVGKAVSDWQNMHNALKKACDQLANIPPHIVNQVRRDEAVSFLNWMADDNFVFLGMRQLRISGEKQQMKIEPVKGQSLGILTDEKTKILRFNDNNTEITPEISSFYENPTPLIITKANTRSQVHRCVHMDYIGLKKYAEDGSLVGELRIAGLFTSVAYNLEVKNIPILRRKRELAFKHFNFDAKSHSGKLLTNIINDFPRDELFQTPSVLLNQHLEKIISLDVLPQVRLIDRNDPFGRFASVIAYVPKEKYSPKAMERIKELIVKEYQGRLSAQHTHHPEGFVSRIHYIIGRNENPLAKPVIGQLKDKVNELLLNYNDLVCRKLLKDHPQKKAEQLIEHYKKAFSPVYQDFYSIEQAVRDVDIMEQAYQEGGFATRFYQDEKQHIHMRICNMHKEVTLSDRVPVLENFGFEVISEHVFELHRLGEPNQSETIVLHDMVLRYDALHFNHDKTLAKRLQHCYNNIRYGLASNDAYNKLIIRAALNWHETALFRAFGRYLKQAGSQFEQAFIANTLCKHADITKKIYQLFTLIFEFQGKTAAKKSTFAAKKKNILDEIEQNLKNVSDINDDIIIRRIYNLIAAIMRTNFYQKKADGQSNEVISFKIAGKNLDFTPEPKPFAEIFVCSPRIEGVHMRFGAIARGGLRWSDRDSDFRTEILGLAKAQQVKNAVIVPVGAKGGFVAKKLGLAKNKDEFMQEGIAAYRIFISSLLELTDNIIGDKIVPCPQVVRYDGDDTYLVVAADKGTAAFSDIANEISEQHGFWLGDAFASGGSCGYDHKKMGITAKGAWEAVKRHFRERNHDIQKQPVSVIGVGDMSGDVFGNGMLLSEQIKLIAAFDHRDILLDPNPDIAKSYKERKRLFDNPTPRGWQDYDKKILSPQGAIFKRSEKIIKLNSTLVKMLGAKTDTMRPDELIKTILQLPVDLLWFGGIGTYVCDEHESDIDVGDHANNAIRIKAGQLAVKALGEGANLGTTHKARIKFAANGGQVNTDAVDNAAGVNSSDYEVNIKIALGKAIQTGKIDAKKRGQLLTKMTDEVAKLVLRNNYKQTLGISMTQKDGKQDLPFQLALIHDLEARGLLNREVEFLPQDSEIENLIAEGKKLTRPEIAVLVSYAKITLFDEIMQSGITDDEVMLCELINYFPKQMHSPHKDEIIQHKLRGEIIATVLSNSIVNDCGPTIVKRMQDETQTSVEQIVKSYVIAKKAFGIDDINRQIDELDNQMDGNQQLGLYCDVRLYLNMVMSWLLFNEDMQASLSETTQFYKQSHRVGHEVLLKYLQKVIPDSLADLQQKYRQTPLKIQQSLLSLAQSVKLCDVALIGKKQRAENIKPIIEAYVKVAQVMSIIGLISYTENHNFSGYFEKLAIDRMNYVLKKQLRGITEAVLAKGDVQKWIADNEQTIQWIKTRTRRAMADEQISLAEIVTLSGNYEKILN